MGVCVEAISSPKLSDTEVCIFSFKTVSYDWYAPARPDTVSEPKHYWGVTMNRRRRGEASALFAMHIRVEKTI
jgi:hypothetical protein